MRIVKRNNTNRHETERRDAHKKQYALGRQCNEPSENEVWHIHEVSYYDDASFYAERQKFTIRKGIVKEQFC